MKSEHNILPAEFVSFELPYKRIHDTVDKTVLVYLPERTEDERLPVIYMTDGQSVFKAKKHPKDCWFAHEAAAEVFAASGKKAIIVGIYSEDEPLWRMEELTPASIGKLLPPPFADSPDELPDDFSPLPEGKSKDQLTSEDIRKIIEEMTKDVVPQGELFAEFVVGQVLPAVETRFPVAAGRENTTILGASSGGLESFFIAMTHPERFCAIGALSPVFGFYQENDINRWTEAHLREDMPFVYLYFGTGMKKEIRFYEGSQSTFALLKAKAPRNKVKEVINPAGIHHESSWAPVFQDFLLMFLNGLFS